MFSTQICLHIESWLQNPAGFPTGNDWPSTMDVLYRMEDAASASTSFPSSYGEPSLYRCRMGCLLNFAVGMIRDVASVVWLWMSGPKCIRLVWLVLGVIWELLGLLLVWHRAWTWYTVKGKGILGLILLHLRQFIRLISRVWWNSETWDISSSGKLCKMELVISELDIAVKNDVWQMSVR